MKKFVSAPPGSGRGNRLISNALSFVLCLVGYLFPCELAADPLEPAGPDSYTSQISSDELEARFQKQKASESRTVNSCLELWQSFKRPRHSSPPAFVYKVEPKGQEFKLVERVLYDAIRRDKSVRNAAQDYRIELKLLKAKDEVVRAVHDVYDVAGLRYEGSEDDKGLLIFGEHGLAKRALGVFDGDSRSIYSGIVTARTEDDSLSSVVLLIVDRKHSEISLMAAGDLFDKFSRNP